MPFRVVSTAWSPTGPHGIKTTRAPPDPIRVAIETSLGLLVACLRAGSPSPRRSRNTKDAVALANILRTDTEFHRPLPTGSDLIRAIAVLARAQQDSVWGPTRAHNRPRSHLREY
ncbi:IS110 family transposase [Streptomyces humi]|uniref:IS110 family transposase n=1 Tax=Streptomyces humi TaxID=1428620 RepID=UPI00069A639E